MTEERLPSKFTFILHADIAGSTALVQQDEELAHKRIQDTFRRFDETITKYHGHVQEIRGDALLAEFERASDTVTAALAFQADQSDYLAQLEDDILPSVRVGIAMGEVIIADDTLTGTGVVLAQRVEQLAEPGGVCITGAIHEALPPRLPFDQNDLGEQQVKGFDEPVRVYTVQLRDGAELPEPTLVSEPREPKSTMAQSALVAAVVILICGGALLAWIQPWKPDFEPASVEKMVLPLPDKPSIAVLPFDNYSGEEKLDFFADGLTENITSALSKAPGLFVIARNSAATYKGEPVNVKQVAEDLGVQYVLEGSVQKSGDKLRITAQLVDAIKGHHLWTDRFDRQAGDVFAIQDEITKRVFTELQVELTEGEHARMAAGGTDNLDAWLLRIEAYSEYIKFTRESQIRARELYQAAHEADPGWAFPVAGIAFTHWYEARRGWSDSRDESIRLGIEAAEQAIELQPNEPIGYMALGNLMFLTGKLDQAIEYRRKAIELAPNAFTTVGGLAIRLSEANQEQEAVELFERAIRLSPKHPWWVEFGYGMALHLVGRKEEAVEIYKRGLNTGTGGKSAPLHARLAAVYADLGRMDKAKAEINEVLRLNPKFTAATYQKSYPFPTVERNNWYKDLLVQSGLPEHPPLKLPDKPSIAVLPFKNFSSDMSLDYMSDGISEDIITALARSPWMLVMSRTSSFAYKDRAITAQEVGEELGVQYVLEGSVQKGSNTVRVTAQLIDTADGSHLWAERFDQASGDVLEIQDAVTEKINQTIGSLSGVLLGQVARERAWRKEGVALEEYDYVLRGHGHFLRWTQAEMAKAREIFEQGLIRFPDSALLRAKVAWARYVEVLQGWSVDSENDTTSAIQFAEEVLADQRASLLAEYLAHWVLGYLYSTTDVPRAMAEIEAAVALVPGGGMTRADLAGFQFFTGQTKQGWENMALAERIDPHYAWIIYYKAFGLRIGGECGEAILIMESFFESPLKYLFIAACREQLNEHVEAKIALAKAEELWPGVTVSAHRDTLGFSDQPVVQEYLEDLRRVGLPN